MQRPRRDLVCIILAAGQGKRMRSKQAKVLHSVAGRPMLEYVLDQAVGLGAGRILIVIGHDGQRVRETLSGGRGKARARVEWVVQESVSGTGHAVQRTQPLLEGDRGTVIILNGDQPLLTPQTLSRLLEVHREEGAVMTLLTAHLADPQGYGRVLRDGRGRVSGVVEESDATEAEKGISEVNMGVYAARTDALFSLLEEIRPDNIQGEYYLTDTVRLAVQKGQCLRAVCVQDPEEALGINTRLDLARAEKLIRRKVARRWMLEGVTLLDPEATRIDSTAVICRDTVIYPFTLIEGETSIGEDCVISSHVRLQDSRLGRGVKVGDHCVISQSILEDEVSVGPFAHLRPGTVVRRRAKIGNFVEVKKSEIGPGSKANHLSYLGDAIIGRDVNIGAGTITCNYDGTQKFQTIIEDQVFVGSNTQLIAPVRVGRGATIAAGSTITRDVPPGSLVVARAKQVTKMGWSLKKRKELSLSRKSSGKSQGLKTGRAGRRG